MNRELKIPMNPVITITLLVVALCTFASLFIAGGLIASDSYEDPHMRGMAMHILGMGVVIAVTVSGLLLRKYKKSKYVVLLLLLGCLAYIAYGCGVAHSIHFSDPFNMGVSVGLLAVLVIIGLIPLLSIKEHFKKRLEGYKIKFKIEKEIE